MFFCWNVFFVGKCVCRTLVCQNTELLLRKTTNISQEVPHIVTTLSDNSRTSLSCEKFWFLRQQICKQTIGWMSVWCQTKKSCCGWIPLLFDAIAISIKTLTNNNSIIFSATSIILKAAYFVTHLWFYNLTLIYLL